MLFGWGDSASSPWVARVQAMRREQPHYKPALLLSALDLADAGTPVDRIPIEPLAHRFAEVLRLAGLSGNVSMPTWHLARCSGTPIPFWEIEWRQPTSSQSQPKDAAALLRRVAAVRFDPEVAAELRDAAGRWLARQAIYDLLERDGRPMAIALLQAWPEDLIEVRDVQGVLESQAERAFHLDDDEPRTAMWTHAAVVRDRGLRNIVLPQYESRCALCAVRLRWNGVAEIELAHVKPRALGGVDDPRNTMPLCRTHHWAFDRFLWTVLPDEWAVRVQRASGARDDDLDALLRHSRLEGMPSGIRHPPHRLALEWHAARFAAQYGS
jgi:hypothetical protein